MSSINAEAVAYSDILAARDRAGMHVVYTPLLENPFINTLAGRRVLVKAECLQRTGSFKFRGAWSAVSALSAEERASGVIAFSSGNHAQGVALAASLHQAAAVILMPNDAPKLKIENTKALGAEVILYDRPGGENREEIGLKIATERGLTLIKPYDNRAVIAGQGTCGLEIAEQATQLGIEAADVLVCCGGGGLTSGVALALEPHSAQFKVRPVEPELGDDVARSLVSGQREMNHEPIDSICDAIVTPSPGELTFPIMHRLCGAGLTVTDKQALFAMAQAMLRFKLVLEPGGAVALAAALCQQDVLEQDTIICVVSGGNADPKTLVDALNSL